MRSVTHSASLASHAKKLVMSNLVSHEEGQPDLSGIDLTVSESILLGGTQFADCLENNVKCSLVYFSTSLACLFRGYSCIRCCLYLVHRHAPPELKGPFLESL